MMRTLLLATSNLRSSTDYRQYSTQSKRREFASYMPIYPSNRLDFALRSYTRFADGYALMSGDNHAYVHTLAGQSATFLEGNFSMRLPLPPPLQGYDSTLARLTQISGKLFFCYCGMPGSRPAI